MHLEAGRRIWLVSPAYARSLESVVPEGSLTNGGYAKVKRVLGHIEDLVQSVTVSPQYFGEVAGEYAEAIKDHLPEIIGITAGFILAESASAFLAATPTGVGQLAVVVIQLGLAAFGASFAVDAGSESPTITRVTRTQLVDNSVPAWNWFRGRRQVEPNPQSPLEGVGRLSPNP
ncbi:MAG: hypothetical protein MJE77_30120 [Proteobacteria bacterium]|nr:hypothetical protein [Pseudomonadota bacterium]